MAYPQGINFRATAGYVTDGAGDTYEIGTTANYPRTTPQGNVVGWEDAITGTRDRTVQDPRLSGIHYFTSTTGVTARFRFDLPAAGSYDIRLAAGDPAGGTYAKIELFDTTTSLGVLVNQMGTAIAANSFADAANTIYTYANWLTSNTAVSKTFASTICRFKIGAGLGANEAITHLRVAATAAAGSATVPGATLTGASTITPGAATGGTAGSAPGATLTGTSTIAAGAATATNTGTLTSDIFRAWGSAAALTALTVPRTVILKASDGSSVLNLGAQVTNGAGAIVIASSSIVTGTWYMMANWDPASPLTSRGFKAYLAT